MVELKFHVRKDTGIPVYVQLEQQIRLLLHRGVLRPGDPMPTVRQLAVDLEVNSNTVARVYRDLQRDSVLELRRGVGTFVSSNSATKPVGKRDLRGLERRVDELISLGKRLGLTPVELLQMLENRWKENSHDQG